MVKKLEFKSISWLKGGRRDLHACRVRRPSEGSGGRPETPVSSAKVIFRRVPGKKRGPETFFL